MRGTSKQKLYQELGLVSLRLRLSTETFAFFITYLKTGILNIFSISFLLHTPYTTRNVHNFPIFKSKHNFFKNSFFPSTTSEWNKLAPSLRNSENFLTFKKTILQFIEPAASSVYNCHNPKVIKLITQLRLGLYNLRERIFKYNF